MKNNFHSKLEFRMTWSGWFYDESHHWLTFRWKQKKKSPKKRIKFQFCVPLIHNCILIMGYILDWIMNVVPWQQNIVALRFKHKSKRHENEWNPLQAFQYLEWSKFLFYHRWIILFLSQVNSKRNQNSKFKSTCITLILFNSFVFLQRVFSLAGSFCLIFKYSFFFFSA